MENGQLFNDTLFLTQIGIALFGLAAMVGTLVYLQAELKEWDKGLLFLIALSASQLLISLSFKGQGSNSTWLYFLSLLTNVWLLLTLRHIRPTQKTLLWTVFRSNAWLWFIGAYVFLTMLAFSLLTGSGDSSFPAFLDVHISSACILLFSLCAAYILWHRNGQVFALLMGCTGLFLILAQGFLFGEVFPDSTWKTWVLGHGLQPREGYAMFIVGRAGFIMSILNLSQTWLKIRMEETKGDTRSRNWIAFALANNELSISLRMQHWPEAVEGLRIESQTVRRDLVKVAEATRKRAPIAHQAGVNYSRIRAKILEALNQALPADKQLQEAELFGGKIKETILKFDPDQVELSEEIVAFFQ